jgi:trigger factor
MSDTEKRDPDDTLASSQELVDQATEVESENEEAAELPKLNLDVKIDSRSACERHITVSVSREDIDRYFDKEYSELMPAAQVPGFRPGHAPRKLVEHRFRKDVAQRVKSSLLMDSLTQIHADQDISAISEPDIDIDAVEVPDEGPMLFEFDLEVRPDFEMPQWKGLKLKKPVHEFTADDVEKSLQKLLANRGRLVPFDGPAEAGDYVTTNLRFEQGGQVLASSTEETIRIRPVLSFRDGKIEGFDTLMAGVRGGETRQGEVLLTEDAPNVGLRGQKVAAIFEVLEVKKLEKPELTPELLQELGGFELEADLRDAIKDALVRRMDHQQRQQARQQITAALTVAANWDLPPALLERQSHRELQRAVMELQRSGFSDDEIRNHENILRQNSRASTAQALKEHFILERIAEDQELDVDDKDYEDEIRLIAAQSNESPRRVRAKLEKAGSMDVLRNQIVERKVIDLILENAQFEEVPYQPEETDVEAVELTAGGGDQSEIPAAKPGGAEAAPHGRPEAAHGKEITR